jgi:hypothetical protein
VNRFHVSHRDKIPFPALEAYIRTAKALPPGKHKEELFALYSSVMDWMRRLTALIVKNSIISFLSAWFI